MKVAMALATFLAFAGAASAQDDAFLLPSDEVAPDFESEPPLDAGPAALLVEEQSATLEKSTAELLGEEPAAPSEPAQEEAPPAPPAPRESEKKAPGLGLALALAGVAGLALALRRKA